MQRFSKDKVFDRHDILKPNFKLKSDALNAVQRYRHHIAEKDYVKQMVETTEGKLKYKKSYLEHDKNVLQDESLMDIKNMIGDVLQKTN